MRYRNHIRIRHPNFLLFHLIMTIFIAKNLHFIRAVDIRAIPAAAALVTVVIVEILVLLPFHLLRPTNKAAL